jgi:rubrerythrin
MKKQAAPAPFPIIVECVHCGYKWIARVPNPKACPNCKQYQVKYKKEK